MKTSTIQKIIDLSFQHKNTILLSANCYGNRKHLHWLKSVCDNNLIINRFISLNATLIDGIRMLKTSRIFQESKNCYTYHLLADHASGELKKTLSYAAAKYLLDTNVVDESEFCCIMGRSYVYEMDCFDEVTETFTRRLKNGNKVSVSVDQLLAHIFNDAKECVS